ncbi:MAG TPA: TGS domain-containing protein [archaeon]|nr:TGS domain-containing protein [archaeon]
MDLEQNALNFVEERNEKENQKQLEKIIKILKQKQLEEETILAAILQDTLYKNKTTYEEIKEKYGEKTAQITKECANIQDIIEKNINKIENTTLSELIITITTTLEPIIIKVTECAVNLKEINAEEKEKTIKIAENIYSPLAIKFGISGVDWQIQDYVFKLQNPQGYEKIKKMVNKTREEREELINEIRKEVEKIFEKEKIKIKIYGRPKNFKSIYEKLKKVSFNRMYDLYGIRIICEKEKQCYEALGIVHSKYEIIQEAFDDYIARPKNNGYKSIHTAVFRGKDIIEFQIRTWDQHLRIESSLYWQYKRVKKFKELEKEISWERQLIEWQKDAGDDQLKKRNLGKKIFVFTPKNEAIILPQGATPIDFAYAVHTEIGKKIFKIKINGEAAPIETKLKNLDKVEIITALKPTIQKSWLNHVVSEKAKSKIKNYFKIKTTPKKSSLSQTNQSFKKIKMAECCHPLPGEDVIGVKTTKRKIIIHKKDCKNIQNLPKNKLVDIAFEKEKGTTEIKITAIERPGLLVEILTELKKGGATLNSTNFKIKKSGYLEAILKIEVSSYQKLEKLLEKLQEIPSIQQAERI